MVAVNRLSLLMRRALSALLLGIAIACAVPAADSTPLKRVGSAFSADTADMAVLPTRAAARPVAAPANPEPLVALLATAPLSIDPLPASGPETAEWPRSRAPPPSAWPDPVSRPRAPPTA